MDSVISKGLLHLRPLQREGLLQLQNTHTAPQGWVSAPRMAGGIGECSSENISLIRCYSWQAHLPPGQHIQLGTVPNHSKWPQSAVCKGHQFSHGWLLLAIQAKMGPLSQPGHWHSELDSAGVSLSPTSLLWDLRPPLWVSPAALSTNPAASSKTAMPLYLLLEVIKGNSVSPPQQRFPKQGVHGNGWGKGGWTDLRMFSRVSAFTHVVIVGFWGFFLKVYVHHSGNCDSVMSACICRKLQNRN